MGSANGNSRPGDEIEQPGEGQQYETADQVSLSFHPRLRRAPDGGPDACRRRCTKAKADAGEIR